MKKTNIVIFGASRVAQLVYAYIQDDAHSSFHVACFCVDAAYHEQHEMFGRPVVKFEEVDKLFPPSDHQFLVAIGYHSMNAARAEKCAQAEAKNYRLANYIHPNAAVSKTAKIGKNVIILDHVSVGPFAEIGDNVCLYPNATVAHHATVSRNTWVTSGTTIGGNSVIGKNSFLGLNSTVGHNIVIGDENFIGAGAVVTRNTADKEVHIIADAPKHRLNTDQFLKLFKFD